MIDRNNVIEAYGEKAMSVIASDLGVTKFNERTRSGLCPVHPEKTPSFTFNPKTNIFHCFGCGHNVDIVSHTIDYNNMSYVQAIEKLCDELGLDADTNKVDKSQEKRIDKAEYKKPPTDTKKISEGIIAQAEKRKINKSTLEFWRVEAKENKSFLVKKEEFKDAKEYNGRFYVKRNAIAFKCYNQENELVNIAYRSKEKLFAQEQGCKLIMYGAWHVDPSKPLVITEGQFDALAIWQSGMTNVVSLPAGASNRKYLEVNYEFLNQFPELIFWIDNDNAGRNAGENLKEKFPNARVVIHKECNDPNETLIKFGANEIVRFLNEPPPLPRGIKGISEAHYSVDDPSESERIETGFADFDSHVKDWRMQQLTVVFGRDNEGKSTFISQMVGHQLYRGMKTFLNSAELGDQGIQNWLYTQIVNGEKRCYRATQGKYGVNYSLKEGVLEAIRRYTENKLYIVDPTDTEMVSDNDILFKRMSILATKFGVKLFILDNLQAILTSKFADLNRDQSFFMERCRQFAKTYNCHVIVVAHPHKVGELLVDDKTSTGNLTKDNISGSKDISNKAHNVISIERDFAEGERDFDMILTNLKNKENSIRKGFKYGFQPETLNFYNDDVEAIGNEHTWKKHLADDVDRKTFEKIRLPQKDECNDEMENFENIPV